MKLSRNLVNALGAPIVLALFCSVAYMLIASREAPPTFPVKQVPVNVSVMRSAPESATPAIKTFGNTQAYLSSAVSSQIGGEILEISPAFEVGSSVTTGQWLVKIEPTDYQANLANRRSALAAARQALAQEQTRSQLAEEDWLASGKRLQEATELALRIPQLEAARAALTSAEAAVEQAETDLERTTIRAPFDAIIQSRTASPGDILTRGAAIGSLLARERIQVRLPITPNQAARLTLPRFGASSTSLQATLTTPSLPGREWHAVISRVEPMIDKKSQSIFLVGDIADPFEDPNAFLPVGAFVNATITGAPIDAVHKLPEAAVVDDSFVWVVGPENSLAKQQLEIVFSQDRQILAHIDEPLFQLPLRILNLPLASFNEGAAVVAIEANSQL